MRKSNNQDEADRSKIDTIYFAQPRIIYGVEFNV